MNGDITIAPVEDRFIPAIAALLLDGFRKHWPGMHGQRSTTRSPAGSSTISRDA